MPSHLLSGDVTTLDSRIPPGISASVTTPERTLVRVSCAAAAATVAAAAAVTVAAAAVVAP